MAIAVYTISIRHGAYTLRPSGCPPNRASLPCISLPFLYLFIGADCPHHDNASMWNPLRSQKAEVISHWYALIPNFNTSTQEFYSDVEKEVEARQVPGLTMSRVDEAFVRLYRQLSPRERRTLAGPEDAIDWFSFSRRTSSPSPTL